MTVLTDDQIRGLLEEPKQLPEDYRKRLLQMTPKANRAHREGSIDIEGEHGSHFRLITRQQSRNPFDFSVILIFDFHSTTGSIRLRRYNGKTGPHYNALENEIIEGFHIHQATERYQLEPGHKADSYAIATDRYTDIHSALACMIEDCGFIRPDNDQIEMLIS